MIGLGIRGMMNDPQATSKDQCLPQWLVMLTRQSHAFWAVVFVPSTSLKIVKSVARRLPRRT